MKQVYIINYGITSKETFYQRNNLICEKMCFMIARMTAQVKDSGLQFHPRKGDILICDFKGNIVSEIVKRRPVVVLRDRLPYRTGLVIVVPLSSTAPEHEVSYSFQLSKNYLSRDETPQYAKCDLVCSVSLARLDRIKFGYRKYAAPRMDDVDFQKVIIGVKAALGFAH